MKKVLILISVLLLLSMASVTLAINEENFWCYIKEADYQKAAETAVLIGRDIPEYYYLAGICFLHVFNYEEYHIYDNYFWKYGDNNKLKELILENEKQSNKDPQIILLKGIIATINPQIDLGDPKVHLKKARKKLKDNAYVYNYLGLSEMNKYNYSLKVKKYIEKAIELKPDYPEPYNNLAVIYHYNGKKEEGIDALISCLENCPLVPNNTYQNLLSLVSFNVGLLITPCEGRGNTYNLFAPALNEDYLEKIKSISNKIHLLKLAEAYLQKGNSRTPDSLISDESFTDFGLYNYIGFLISNLDGDYEGLKRYANFIIEEDKLDYRRLLECANILLHSGEHNLATLIYQNSAKKVHPDDEVYLLKIYSNMGTNYYCNREYEKAIDVLEKALVYNSQDVISLEKLGLSYRDVGDLEKAEECFEKAISYTTDQKYKEYLEKLLIDIKGDNNE